MSVFNQIGNISKVQRFKLLCPTEREARIALGNQHDGVEYIANLLIESTESKNLILKLGAEGFIAYDKELNPEFLHRQYFPTLVVNPVDVAGAGDSLLATVSMGMSRGLALEGLKPWVYTITPFPIERPIEQVKLDIDQQMQTLN